MGSQISSGNRFSTFRMEITESSSAFFYKYPIPFQKESFEILPEYALMKRHYQWSPVKKLFLCLEFSITGSDAIGNHTLIFRIKVFPALCGLPNILFSNFPFGRSQQIHLIQIFPAAHIHHFLLEMNQIFFVR